MRNVIVIGNKLETSGPDHLLPQIWKSEKWVLVRESALALHVSCADKERILVSGLNSHPPDGTIIKASEIYSYSGDEDSHFSGIWMYTDERHQRSIDAYFRHLKERSGMNFSRLTTMIALKNVLREQLFDITDQMYKG